jgi:tripartite-type tricarboxylate transporter receptor subunit TctC
VPTAAEAGLKGFEVTTWYALWAPKGTPDEIVVRMRKEVAEALKTDAIRAAWERNGSDVPSLAGDDLTRFISSEIRRWQTVVQQQVVRLD